MSESKEDPHEEKMDEEEKKEEPKEESEEIKNENAPKEEEKKEENSEQVKEEEKNEEKVETVPENGDKKEEPVPEEKKDETEPPKEEESPKMIEDKESEPIHTDEEEHHEIIFENIEPSDQVALYVSNPTLTKDTIGSYINYTVMGTKVPEPLVRRFRDFDTLRAKLRLRWPGIFIPRLPHKKTVGNKNREVVDMRVEMINRFCVKLSSLTQIFNSEEISLFIKDDPNAMKELSELKEQNYEEIYEKYAQAFPDGTNEYDFEAYKEKIASFAKNLKNSIQSRKDLQETITKIKEHYLVSRKSLIDAISLFDLYEKEWLSKIRENEKLILRNISNRKIGTSISQFEITAKSQDTPYDNFYNTIKSDMLIAEAYVETYESLQKLMEEKTKMEEKLKELNEKLENNKSGKKSFASMITFKSVEEESTGLTKDKETLEKNISNLASIINICVYNMKCEADKCKLTSLKDYYKELMMLRRDVNKYSQTPKQLYDFILEEQNIEKTHIDWSIVKCAK